MARIELTRSEQRLVDRVLKDLRNPIRYAIYHSISPRSRAVLWHNYSDGACSGDLEYATVFKELMVAKAVVSVLSNNKPSLLRIARISCKGKRRRVLRKGIRP